MAFLVYFIGLPSIIYGAYIEYGMVALVLVFIWVLGLLFGVFLYD